MPIASSSAARKFVTSFTDAQPIHGWTTEHALRELWQNFRDGVQSSFPNQVIELKKQDGVLLYHARLKNTGRQVGFLDCRKKDRLCISQENCVLTLEHLQLASSKHPAGGSIGGHGEGFKVAINLLLRLGA